MRKIIFFLMLSSLLTACDDFNQRLIKESQMFTQQHCPQRLDAYTMLDSIVYHTDEQTLKRYFTINGASAETLQRDSSQIAIALLEELKADTQMKDCKDHKINFDYLYRIKGNDAIALQITLSAHLYSKH